MIWICDVLMCRLNLFVVIECYILLLDIAFHVDILLACGYVSVFFFYWLLIMSLVYVFNVNLYTVWFVLLYINCVKGGRLDNDVWQHVTLWQST